MNILYGVVGDGLGHAIRSSVIIKKLIEDGHNVHIVVSGDGVDYMRQRFPSVSRIWGLTVTTKDNKINPYLTAYGVFRGALSGLPRNIFKFFEVERRFDPDLVISDFETWTWLFSRLNDVPLIALDNVHMLTHVEHDEEITDGLWDKFRMARMVAEARVPDADHYLVSAYTRPPVKKPDTTLIPPVLRRSILEAQPTDGDHLLVYQTSYSTFETSRLIRQLDIPVKAYGLRPDIDHDVVEGNITYRPFSEDEFIADLASCRAVFASAGFTLLTEAMNLGKPYFALPVEGQIEQMLNGRYIEKLGYGTYSMAPTKRDLDEFLDNLPAYRDALDAYDNADNDETFRTLDAVMAQLVPDTRRSAPSVWVPAAE
jgi:uncharacterized protein (TIGR00661 family)